MANRAAEKDPKTGKIDNQAASPTSPASVQPEQAPAKSEEANLSGHKEKEQHHLLRENVEKGRAERHPDLPAGQHATGSFTGENEARK